MINRCRGRPRKASLEKAGVASGNWREIIPRGAKYTPGRITPIEELEFFCFFPAW